MKTKIVAADEGEKFWLVGDYLTFKLSAKDTNSAFSLGEAWAVPEMGPPPHVHRREDEMFLVFEGTLRFVRGNKTFVGGPGTAVYLKRGIPHTFKNVGKTPAKFLTLSIPSTFEHFVRDCGEGVEQIPCTDKSVTPAVIGKLMAATAKHEIDVLPNHQVDGEAPAPAAAPQFWVLGEKVTIRLTSEQTGGSFSVAEVESQPRGQVPPHRHVAMDEIFYVLEGQYEFTIDGQTQTVNAGGTVFVPRGTLHGFRNASPRISRLLDLHTPGGFEQFFEECGVPCTSPDRVVVIPPPEKLQQLLDKHGMTPD